MMHSSLVSLLLVLPTLFSLAAAKAPIIAQYWPAYSTQTPAQIDWNNTDLAYYFVTVTTTTGFEIPDGQSTSDLQAFVADAKQASSKAVFTVGGWTGSLHFSTLVATNASQATFAQQIKSFMDQYNFDGVDIDWEYPNDVGIGCNAVSPDDAANFLSFLETLRNTIGSDKLITAAVSVNGILGSDGQPLTSLKAYGDYLDYVNLMDYDVSGSWSTTTGPNAPLRSCSSSTSAQAAVELWTKAGFPASKILLGIPTYSHSFTTNSSTLETTQIGSYSSQLYQPWTGVTPKGGPDDSDAASTDACGTTSSGYSGEWEYSEMISNGLLTQDGLNGTNGYTRYFDDCTQTPFLFNPQTRDLIAYEDPQSAGVKAAYASTQGLGGVMIFDSTGTTPDFMSSIKENLKTLRSRCKASRKNRRQ
ncbi:hypothetical protein JCM1840_006704 [Sporobolomyces johnsonii]